MRRNKSHKCLNQCSVNSCMCRQKTQCSQPHFFLHCTNSHMSCLIQYDASTARTGLEHAKASCWNLSWHLMQQLRQEVFSICNDIADPSCSYTYISVSSNPRSLHRDCEVHEPIPLSCQHANEMCSPSIR